MQHKYDAIIKTFVVTSIITVGVLSSVYYMGFLAYHLLKGEAWVLDIIKRHPAATILTPIGGIAAYCVVMLLEFKSGNINIEIGNVKFSGAAGGVIFWILTFLAINVAVKLVW